MQRRWKQVDVFATGPFTGNPVAVVLDGEGLSTAEMGAIARWTNLSETTFVLPPRQGGDYHLRIFTPRAQEMPFAGHPTLGSAHAVLEAAGVIGERELVQECGAGLVNVRGGAAGADGRVMSLVAPPATATMLDPGAVFEIMAALASEAELERLPLLVNVGPRWVVVDLGDEAAVARLAPDQVRLEAVSRVLGITGVTAFGRIAGQPHLRVRSFAPAEGVPEDPVCGSGNASVAAYLVATDGVGRVGPSYTALQGQEVGRDGRVEVTIAPGEAGQPRITVGGLARTRVDGTLDA